MADSWGQSWGESWGRSFGAVFNAWGDSWADSWSDAWGSDAGAVVTTVDRSGDAGVEVRERRKPRLPSPSKYDISHAVELINGRYEPAAPEEKRPKRRAVIRNVRKIAQKAAQDAVPWVSDNIAAKAAIEAMPAMLTVVDYSRNIEAVEAAVREYFELVAAIAYEMQAEEDELTLIMAVM